MQDKRQKINKVNFSHQKFLISWLIDEESCVTFATKVISSLPFNFSNQYLLDHRDPKNAKGPEA